MRSRLALVLLPAVCLCWQTGPIHAQQSPGGGSARPAEAASATSQPAAERPRVTGGIAGVVKDSSGAVVARAKVEAKNRASGAAASVASDALGRFDFEGIPAGSYQVTVEASGFEAEVIHDLTVAADGETKLEITLRIAAARTRIEVKAEAGEAGAAIPHSVEEEERAQSRNSAELLGETPGVSLRENGQLASVPMLHGMGDERAKLMSDGMTVSSACPNHMNAPLSYVSPYHAAQVTAMAGITPVSMGGDSLGGTVAVESREPVFAKAGEKLHAEAVSTGFYRSNGEDYGGSFTEWVAGRNLSLGYGGMWATNDDYTDGSGHKVTSTYAQSTDHTVTLAGEGGGNLVSLQAGLHHTPYEGFANAQMDLVRNYAESLNLRYRKSFESGAIDTRVFWQNTWHSMNIGRDKSTFPMPMWMPMQTHGRDLGYSARLDLPLGARHTLRAGNELHRFVLDDDWPAVAGAAPMMGPNTFVNVNNGRRIRLGTFAEAASRWNPKWTTLLGLRNDTVWSNAGPVQGYSDTIYGADAAAFNALNRAHTDFDLDATALARYEPNGFGALEFGYARKTRAPNLYERYAWSTNWMTSGMIGWFGDGNYYVGNVGLKPETAHTVSGTATLRGRARQEWEAKITPYLTYIQDYVDVDTLATTTMGMSTFAQLQFSNHKARIYGADLSGRGALWQNGRFGEGTIGAVAGLLRGERLDTQTGLYQMMPANVRVTLDEAARGFTGGFGVQAVDRKSNVDPHRYEQTTPGYTLFNFHAGYRRGHLRMCAAGDNLLNKDYELPLGGVNFDDFMASGWMGQIEPLTGRGRSFYGSLTAQF